MWCSEAGLWDGLALVRWQGVVPRMDTGGFTNRRRDWDAHMRTPRHLSWMPRHHQGWPLHLRLQP